MDASSSSVASRTGRPVITLSTGDGAIGSKSSHSVWLPACPSCAKILPPAEWTASVSRRRPGSIASSWIPFWASP